jgi:hypothetical protein
MFSLLIHFIFEKTFLAKYLDLMFKNVFHNFGFGFESSKRLIPQSSFYVNSNKRMPTWISDTKT